MKVLAATFLLAFAYVLASVASAAPSKTLLWEITSPHRTLYVTGDTQMLTRHDYPLPKPVLQAFQHSGELVLEGVPGASTKQAHTLMVQYGMLTPPGQLGELLDAAQLQQVKQTCSALGIPFARLQPLRPWLAALVVLQTSKAKLGFDPHVQESQFFFKAAKKRGISFTPLESVSEELRLFAGLPQALQVDWLVMEAQNWKRMVSGKPAQVRVAWRTGNTEVLEKLLAREYRGHAQLFKAIAINRNGAWLRALKGKLATKGAPVFVLVGAGHLVGKGNLISALQNAGYRVAQL